MAFHACCLTGTTPVKTHCIRKAAPSFKFLSLYTDRCVNVRMSVDPKYTWGRPTNGLVMLEDAVYRSQGYGVVATQGQNYAVLFLDSLRI